MFTATSVDASDLSGASRPRNSRDGKDDFAPTQDDVPVKTEEAVFEMDVDKEAEPRSSTESSNGPITPPISPPRLGMSLDNASKDSFTRALGANHANASRDSLLNRASFGMIHTNASRDSLLNRGSLGMVRGNASRDSLLNRSSFGMTHGNASRDSLVSRPFDTAHGNQSRDSLPGRVSTPINLARSASPAAYNSPFNGSPLNRPPSQSGSPFVRADSPLARSLPRMGSSTDMHSASASPAGRGSPRITRENVAKILQKKHSIDSPLREKAENTPSSPPELRPATNSATNSPAATPQRRSASTASPIPAPRLTRDNPTYDGVMPLDPEPQPADPPRPSIAPRAASFDVTADAAGSSAGPPPANDPEDLGFVHLGDMKSALDRLMADVAGEAKMASDGKTVVGLKVEAVTEGVKAGRHSLPDAPEDVEMQDAVSESPVTMAAPEQEQDEEEDEDEDAGMGSAAMHIELPSMGPEALLSASFLSPEATSEPVQPPRPISPRPPVVKDAIKTREELIKAKKREARRREEEMEDEDGSPSGSKDYFAARRSVTTRRRSLSTSDANNLGRASAARRRATMTSDGGLLDNVPIDDAEDDPLANSINRELTRLKGGRTVSWLISVMSFDILTTLFLEIPCPATE